MCRESTTVKVALEGTVDMVQNSETRKRSFVLSYTASLVSGRGSRTRARRPTRSLLAAKPSCPDTLVKVPNPRPLALAQTVLLTVGDRKWRHCRRTRQEVREPGCAELVAHGGHVGLEHACAGATRRTRDARRHGRTISEAMATLVQARGLAFNH